jgi:hypothetical protein
LQAVAQPLGGNLALGQTGASVQESGEAKERCSIAGGVEAWSRKARLKKRLLGRLMAI